MSKGQLQSWLDQDWVRLGADGSIKGSCGGIANLMGESGCDACELKNKCKSTGRELCEEGPDDCASEC